MGKLRFSLSMSLDGFVAGPDPSVEEPLGRGGMQLHEWAVGLEAWRRPHGLEGGEENASTPVVEESLANVGAYLMDRSMFGGGSGPWRLPKAAAVPRPGVAGSVGDAPSPWAEEPWNGWWGDDPPFHVPVLVLTHHAREPLELRGGTTFVFVTDGIDVALERAREAAGDADVVIAGGASVAQQYLGAGRVDELNVSVVPVLLGGGTRLFEHVPTTGLEPARVVEAPGVVHLSYRPGK